MKGVLQPIPTQLHPGNLPQGLWLPAAGLAGHPHPYQPLSECLGQAAELLGAQREGPDMSAPSPHVTVHTSISS